MERLPRHVSTTLGRNTMRYVGRVRFGACLAALLLAVGLMHVPFADAVRAQASGWKPEGPVEIVVPAAAGGGTDRTARVIQKVFQDEGIVETPTVVVNKEGGGGAVGHGYVARHEGDAHYLAVTQPSLLTNKLLGMDTLDHTNFTPIAQLSSEYIGFIVREDSPIKDAKSMLDQLIADPESVVFGVSSALGQANHIALGLVMQTAGVDVKKMRVVVFPSGGELKTALLGGHIGAATSTLANVAGSVEAKELRVLAITSPERLPSPFADVPTWTELGVANAVMGSWRGIVGPPGMTPDQVAYWEQAFAKLSESQEWKDDLANNFAQVNYMDSQGSSQFLDADMEQLTRTLTGLGLVAN
jgi:putative tricarboxylic transport membrane protein